MRRKYLDVTSDEIEIIENAGADNILRISRKYDDVAIHVIEEQARAKRELRQLRRCLRFWEAGITKVVPIIIIAGIISGLTGWLCSEWIIKQITKLGLPTRFWVSATCITMTTCAINTFDTGRLFIWYRGFSYKEEEVREEREENITELIGEPCEEEEAGNWFTAGELARRLGANQSSIELGRRLSKAGYKKKHTNVGNAYLVRKKEEGEKEK